MKKQEKRQKRGRNDEMLGHQNKASDVLAQQQHQYGHSGMFCENLGKIVEETCLDNNNNSNSNHSNNSNITENENKDEINESVNDGSKQESVESETKDTSTTMTTSMEDNSNSNSNSNSSNHCFQTVEIMTHTAEIMAGVTPEIVVGSKNIRKMKQEQRKNNIKNKNKNKNKKVSKLSQIKKLKMSQKNENKMGDVVTHQQQQQCYNAQNNKKDMCYNDNTSVVSFEIESNRLRFQKS